MDAIDKVAKALTDETALPNKPRNTIGFTKDIPGPEMEALLKARMPVSEDAMRELSLKGGIAVRDALIAEGLAGRAAVPRAAKLRAPGQADAARRPRVQLLLSVR
ncbi:MAG: hypothetical protein H7337_22980 [Rhizobacter sp.]|nr:hypothetical protein [Rhizobacter sp.]